MLKKPNRLRRNKSFRYVYRKGRSVATPLMAMIYVRTGRTPGELKVGFSVSKKIGNSVTRNHVRRLMSENLRPTIDQVKTGYMIVFIARQPSRKAGFQQIGQDMVMLLGKANLLLNESRSGP